MSDGAANRTATSLRRFACFVFGAAAVYVATLPFTGRIEAETPKWVFGARWPADLILTWALLVALLIIASVRMRSGRTAWPLLAATWLTIAFENARQVHLIVDPFWIWRGAMWIAVVAAVVAVALRDVEDRAAVSKQRRAFIGFCIALAITSITACLASNLGFRAAAALGRPSFVAYYAISASICALGAVLLRLAGRQDIAVEGSVGPALPLRFETPDLVIAGFAGCMCFAFAWTIHALLVEAGIWRDTSWHIGPQEAFRIILITPVFEEIVFRGVLWAGVRRVNSEWITLLVTAAVFGLMHASSSSAFRIPAPLIMGLVLGALRSGTKSVTPTIFAHMVANALGVALTSDALR